MAHSAKNSSASEPANVQVSTDAAAQQPSTVVQSVITGANSPVSGETRNVRMRHSSPLRSQGADNTSRIESTDRKVVRISQSLPLSPPGDDVAIRTSIFSIRTEGEQLPTYGLVDESSIFYESQRCWALYNKTGRFHRKPPWHLSSVAEDNREKPLQMKWLDDIVLTPFDELFPDQRSKGDVCNTDVKAVAADGTTE
ncbi:unnamed protein product [Trypanosoma congolense IL3000]|uniref:WGS project CAEQ00000000 data, annotated contig 2156 n=1 Tax=Trypanosoma congolense (strain IL3000) TaxID=1068625 RepID=F9WBX3_TRYCI|nr:unnamed protein product [Trypanosoma congolense IL3000]